MRVGTSCFASRAQSPYKDHPHACGDKGNFGVDNTPRQGSSPCVWGQVLDAWNTYKNDRIIPMRVGTSYQKTTNCTLIRDHPHACGDKSQARRYEQRCIGSSPCVWGQVDGERARVGYYRIIPMRVGTSLNTFVPSSMIQDHPHACGDKTTSRNELSSKRGSSPCVWGQDIWQFSINGTVRIIPMRVGTRQREDAMKQLAEDHPHACGDKTKEIKENSGFAKSTA